MNTKKKQKRTEPSKEFEQIIRSAPVRFQKIHNFVMDRTTEEVLNKKRELFGKVNINRADIKNIEFGNSLKQVLKGAGFGHYSIALSCQYFVLWSNEYFNFIGGLRIRDYYNPLKTTFNPHFTSLFVETRRMPY